jgi:H+-translocating NAD(P) transhydrogenase subunit alpha
MTGGLLISVYLFTLALFLGLDVIRGAPPTLYAALATALGAAAGVVVIIAFPAAGADGPTLPAWMSVAAVAVATGGIVGSVVRVRRMVADRRSSGRRA